MKKISLVRALVTTAAVGTIALAAFVPSAESKNYLQGWQLIIDSALSTLGVGTSTQLDTIVGRVDQSLDSPLRMYPSLPADAKLNFTSNRVTSGDGSKRTTGQAGDTVPTFSATSINYTSGAVTGGTAKVDGGSFALPTCTVGQFRRHAYVYSSSNNWLDSHFSSQAASVGALADPGTLFSALDGLGIGFVDLECTNTSGQYKTAGSSTSVIESSVSGTARILNFDQRTGDMAYQSKSNVTITGGSISGVSVGTSTISSTLLFKESGGGSDTIGVHAPALASSYTLTLPVDDGLSGQALTTDGSGVLSWGSIASVPAAGAVYSDGTNLQSETALSPARGGTGIANNAAATLTRSGNHALTLTTSGTTSLTLPTSGTLAAVPSVGVVYSDGSALQTASVTQGGLIYGSAANVVASTGAGTSSNWALSGGTGTPTFSDTTTRAKTITTDDSATTSTLDLATLDHSSTGTPAAGFGSALHFTAESTTTLARDQARIQSRWTTATDASRASALDFQTLTGAGSLTTQMSIAGNGATSITNLSTNGPVFTSGGTGLLNSEATLAVSRGGLNQGSNFVQGGLLYGSSTTAGASSAAGTTSDWALSGGTGAPTFSSTTTSSKTIDVSSQSTLLAQSTNSTAALDLKSYNAAPNASFIVTGSRGSVASPTAIQSGDTIGRLRFFGQYDSTVGHQDQGAEINIKASETWTSSAHGSQMEFYTVANGSTTATNLRMSIANSGLTTIGMSSANDITHIIQNNTNASGSTRQSLRITNNDTNSNSDGGGALQVSKGSPTTSSSAHLVDFGVNGSTGSNAGWIAANGGTPTFGGSSDRRIKKNIADLENPLSTIAALRPVTFQWKADSSPGMGFIAQELRDVLPNNVQVTDDGTGEDLPPGVRPWSMTEGGLLAYLVGAVKELKAQHDALRSEFDAYKAAHP